MAFGIQIRLTSTGKSASFINIDDLAQDARRRGTAPEFTYVPAPSVAVPFPFIDVTYGDRVPMSFERGDIRGYITGGYITARFFFGPLAQQGATGTITVSGPTYTVAPDDRYIFVCSDPAGVTTIQLPPISEHQTGVVQVIDANGDAALNNITVLPAAGETINGGANLVISTNNGFADLRANCDDDNWFDIAGGTAPVAGAVRAYAFSADQRVPGHGTRYLRIGEVPTSATPLVINQPTTLRGASIRVDRVDGARDFDLEFIKNGIVVESLSLPSGVTSAITIAFTTPLVASDEIAVWLVRTLGAGRSTFRNVVVSLEMTES